MSRIDKKTLLGFFVVAAMTFSLLVTPASAAQITMTDETFERVFEADENGHTYLYAEPTVFDMITSNYLNLEEDIDYERYRNGNSGWTRSTGTFSSPGLVPVFWHSHDALTSDGVWGEDTLLPTFWDLDGETNSTTNRRSFALNMGQTTTIAIESELMYIGTLATAGAEFIHLTINSLQDDIEWEFVILDSEDTVITYGVGMDGDITVTPFKPGVGTHYIWIGAGFDHSGLVMFDIHPQAVTPETIPIGNVVQDTLPGSELTVVDGSIVHTEKAPTVRTYKYNSPTELAMISYSFNYPEIMPLASPHMIMLSLSSDAFLDDSGKMRMQYDFPFPLSDNYFYKSIQGETYYLTVMGGDNVQYALYNSVVEDDELPLNEEFLLQNLNEDQAKKGYLLTIEEDSFMKVNSTFYSGSCDWYIYTVTEDMMMRQFTIGYDTYYPDSPFIYIPAGEYVLFTTMDGDYLGEFEFNIGPITEDLTTSMTRVGGFRVPTDALDFFNMTITLLNEDNVTATTDVQLFDRTGRSLAAASYPLSNWWDGSSLMEHSSWDNFLNLPIYTLTSDEYTLIAVSPIYVANNTEGSLTENYALYNVSYSLDWDVITEDYYVDMHTLNVGNGATHVFDLDLPGEASESYYLEMNLTMGVWYNVSIISEDVFLFSADLLHNIGGRIHYTPWNDLDDNMAGTLGTELIFEFGALTENPVFIFDVMRSLGTEGNLTIRVDPFVTNLIEDLPELVPTSDMFAGLAATAPYIAVGGIIIAVVVVVYLKKFKK